MNMSREEIHEWHDVLVKKYSEDFKIIPGMTVTLKCLENGLVLVKPGGEPHYGCGELLIQFQAQPMDHSATWDLLIDTYLAHLHSAHGMWDIWHELLD